MEVHGFDSGGLGMPGGHGGGFEQSGAAFVQYMDRILILSEFPVHGVMAMTNNVRTGRFMGVAEGIC